ncbi:MAG: hypothetical protein JSW05_06440 [Candidatus Thorarchaeota archaeon]|nr:MAG: hypothetical protein JSW05_06440 [Candidatus Thorarchaeota archaeon]
MRRNQGIAGVLIVVVIVGAGAAFVFMTQPTRPPVHSYVYESIGEPESLDPHWLYETAGESVAEQVYETLYTYPWGSGECGDHPEANPTVPLLAASAPVITENGTVYTILLRQDITFHDGTPFNASCVKWNFERAVKMFRLDGPVFMILEPLLGGEELMDIAYDDGVTGEPFESTFENWTDSDAIKVLDTYTLQFNLAYAYAGYIPATTYYVGAFMSPSYVLAHSVNDTVPAGGDWRDHYGIAYGTGQGAANSYMFDHTCGTGPYQVVEWKKDEYVHMVLNEDYWRANATEAAIAPPSYAGSIKEIWRRLNVNQTVMNLNLKTGVVDDISLSYRYADEIYDNVTQESKNPNIFFRTGGESLGVAGLWFELGEVCLSVVPRIDTYSPFHWRGLRKAMAYLLDYDAWIQAVYGGWAVQARGPIPLGTHYQNSSYWTEHYDPQIAVEYWNEAMQDPDFVDVMNEILGAIPLYYLNASGSSSRGQAYHLLQDGFEAMKLLSQMNTTGLNHEPRITVYGYSWAEWLSLTIKPDWLMDSSGWVPDYADPDNFVFPFLHSGGVWSYFSGYNNSVMDDLIMQGRAETDPVVRQQIYNQIQELAAFDQPHIWLCSGKEFTTFRAWLKGIGLRYQPMSSYYYIYHVYKDYENY